jgi:hypothetical protein
MQLREAVSGSGFRNEMSELRFLNAWNQFVPGTPALKLFLMLNFWAILAAFRISSDRL